MTTTKSSRTLIAWWIDNGQQDEVDDLVFEYVRRDLLNRILGNTDNHGRNTSIMRVGGGFVWRQSMTSRQ
ncbi:hypothetical protein [Pseudomonas sp. LAM2023]|uniref:hypothetical protein n=1 Tax=Pseudomonas sp. LAM2023 TaxID=2800477 RepID=UPI003FA3964D